MNFYPDFKKLEIVIVGLGYVGLPLATHFAKSDMVVIGYDTSQKKIDEFRRGVDSAQILTVEEHSFLSSIDFRSNLTNGTNKRVYIVTVPTPVSRDKVPDFSPLISASNYIGSILNPGDIVVYESTVYPGATESICVPLLERKSSLVFGKDFSVGYSPERVNPGDKTRTLDKIIKVVAGSDKETSSLLSDLYGKIVKAGTHMASSIAVAEASKVIENIQRDVNIALMNELHKIFDKLQIDINEVVDAASTKWNFMNVRPGLVGGHCIGVDPYYLIHKAKEVGLNPELIESARLINENHIEYVISKLLKFAIRNKISLSESKILFYGLAFKPNCEDLRNSKAFDVLKSLNDLGLQPAVFDPFQTTDLRPSQEYDLIICVTKHSSFQSDINSLVSNSSTTLIYNLI
ncbi:nucleotide sugar dehydrogenase [Brumicola blandensis]|uniref:Nucleotide sugar dehydrogenase n=1 Tax=Brumicola blandensis TaxID=3075611 RepID=A0AAW8R680_9ALTE|nr:nucleotide sugar dehydrogenase [Alteromonas sp. W409]MDT0582688.1 nucleotide sugar dehydrogenase [Alteromonas sp. W409]